MNVETKIFVNISGKGILLLEKYMAKLFLSVTTFTQFSSLIISGSFVSYIKETTGIFLFCLSLEKLIILYF